VRVAPIALTLLLLATGCGRTSTAVDNPCAKSVGQYCASQPNECPTSASKVPFCQWLTARGGAGYGGPVSCPGQGSGWEVESPDGAVWYLFDDGGLSAIIVPNVGPDGGCRAGPGPATGDCVDENVAFGCPIDAARE